jgi:uracil phosphoribosyltransferase
MAMEAINPKAEVLSSPAITMLFTVIRDKTTSQVDFVRAADRLMNILVEEGLGRMATETTVTTPCGEFKGLLPPVGANICAVDIVRSGCILLESFRSKLPDIKTAKILIQRDEETAEPKLFYSKLPAGMDKLKVVLCDPMLATGGSALMAIQVLKEAGVKEEDIFFWNVLSCPEGLKALAEKAPGVKVLTTGMDPQLNSKKYIVPGLGDFGDRYYGTE